MTFHHMPAGAVSTYRVLEVFIHDAVELLPPRLRPMNYTQAELMRFMFHKEYYDSFRGILGAYDRDGTYGCSI